MFGLKHLIIVDGKQFLQRFAIEKNRTTATVSGASSGR